MGSKSCIGVPWPTYCLLPILSWYLDWQTAVHLRSYASGWCDGTRARVENGAGYGTRHPTDATDATDARHQSSRFAVNLWHSLIRLQCNWAAEWGMDSRDHNEISRKVALMVIAACLLNIKPPCTFYLPCICILKSITFSAIVNSNRKCRAEFSRY